VVVFWPVYDRLRLTPFQGRGARLKTVAWCLERGCVLRAHLDTTTITKWPWMQVIRRDELRESDLAGL